MLFLVIMMTILEHFFENEKCSEPLKLDKTNDRGFLMKLTYEQKWKAYKEWKSHSKIPLTIARELSLSESSMRYFLHLADRYGVEVLKHGKNKNLRTYVWVNG